MASKSTQQKKDIMFVSELERAMGQAESHPTARNRHPALLDMRVAFTRGAPFGAFYLPIVSFQR
jgi:hypothetical protein